MPATTPADLPAPLAEALERLSSQAPAHLFPKARALFFRKFPLEGHPADLDTASPPRRFRTFVLRDTTCLPGEGEQPVTRLNELAVVHWQAPQTNPEDYALYLRERWSLQSDAPGLQLQLVEESWFREGGAYARLILIPPAAAPAPAAAAPGSSR